MTSTGQIEVDAYEILDAPGLDQIQVYWRDIGPSQGSVTITCYGCAWTAYFGGMPEGKTIREFFAGVGSDYMLTKLGYASHLKQAKRDHVYLVRIIEAVRASLAGDRRAA